MTSLDREEFERLAVAFGAAWDEQQEQAGKDASKGGRPPELRTVEQRLLFLLFYLKTYPLGVSQHQARL